MPKYATQTTVSVAASKLEIEATLKRYGADQFLSAWDETRAFIGFRINNRQVKIILPLPDPDDDEFQFTPTGQSRSQTAINTAYEQACRQRWRALALVIKAKLEAVECAISTIEREFLADTLMSNGQTVGEWVQPQIKAMYLSGEMPRLLPRLTE